MSTERATRWATWMEHLLPPGLDEDALIRSTFFVRGWVLAVGFSWLTAGLYALGGIWSQVATTGLLAVGGPVLLALHRRGVAFSRLSHVSMALGSLCFGLGALAQHPADYSSVVMLLLIPLLAGFLLERRQAVPWLFLTIGWMAVVVVAADHGWVLDFTDPAPTVSHVVNLTVGLLLAFLFTRTFDGVRAQAIERLRATDRARRAFLATISHEIRTPMNGVLGMTEVLLLEEGLSSGQAEKLRTVQRSGRTLVALINDLLDVSKMEAGKLALEATDFNLDTVLADVHALAAPHAAAKGLRLEVEKEPSLPARVRGDGLRLGQVLNNLVSNAVKFTAAGGVRLTVTRCAGEGGGLRCRFSVTDTGIGLAPEVVPRLFNAFQQGDSSTTRRFGGTGLGLSLSQQLVQLMGGRIEVSSTPGVGSCFWFEAAFDEAEHSTGEHPAGKPTGAPAEREVLVVDDNPINLTVALGLLEKAGYRAQGVVNGKAALEAVQRGGFALVLMDCHMPEMDGFEATERIRALPGPVARTPIVALTASAMPDEVEACRRAGMNSVLPKPVSFARLCEVLREQLG